MIPLIGIAFGFWIGRTLQLVADSGEYLLKKVLTASLIGAFSYLLASFAGFLFNKKFQKTPSWIWIAVLGAMFFAFNKYVIWYLIENWASRKSDSVLDYVSWLFVEQMGAFVFISMISMIPLVLVFLSIRFIFHCIKIKG